MRQQQQAVAPLGQWNWGHFLRSFGAFVKPRSSNKIAMPLK